MTSHSFDQRSKRNHERSAQRRKTQALNLSIIITDLNNRIKTRLEEVPLLWRQKYVRMLESQGLRPEFDLSRIDHNELHNRAILLPPRASYVHMKNSNHPSAREERVVDVKRVTSRGLDCDNSRTMTGMFLIPDRPNVKRIKKNNLLCLTLSSGRKECMHIAVMRTLLKSATFAPSYQNDAHGDHWAEMRVVAESGLPIRVPLWLLERATRTAWPPPPHEHRIKPPHETRYRSHRF